MEGDLLAKVATGIGVIAGGWYAFVRKIKHDRRDDKVTTLHDDAIEQVIKTLREEVERMSVRLAAVEEQNRKCEERNEQLHQEIMELKKSLHVT
jgi:hypothetical protein